MHAIGSNRVLRLIARSVALSTLVLSTLALMTLTLVSPHVSFAQVSEARRAFIGPRLAAELDVHAGKGPAQAEDRRASVAERIRIVVSLKRDDLSSPGAARRAAVRARQDRVMNGAASGAFAMAHRFETLSGYAGMATVPEIERLSRHPEVDALHLDYEVHATLAEGVNLIGADTAHAYGMTGAGMTVAMLDSGIDTDHPDLIDDLVAEHCTCDDVRVGNPNLGCCPLGGNAQTGPGSAEDDNGHGTHTAGIITSGGVVSPVGVAPDAGIVAVKVLAANGNGLTSGVAAGFDWILTNRVALGIDVVNASLGDGGEHNNPLVSPCSGTASANAIGLLHAAGVPVIVASGNDGHDDGISEPACVADAISVGGVYDADVGGVGWCGNAGCTVTLCSDISGPDVFVCHTNSDELLDVLGPDYPTTSAAPGGGTTVFGGTSAASPYVAGQVALLLEADPTLLPEQVRTMLRTSGPLVTNPDNGLSFPRSDIAVALASFSVCGDGVLEMGEDCDDGNVVGGDCCSATCEFESLGASCDDADLCTGVDQCDGAGTCAGGAPLDCDDANGCTDDSCDPVFGCIATNNTSACDDGNACTVVDICSLGECVGASPLACDDGNECTDDACDPVLGCVATNNLGPCDDENLCTMGDSCLLGECVAGPGLPCDDGDACTDDACDPDLGCFAVVTSCDDNDPCTAESCDAITGCAHTPILGCPAPVPAGTSGSRHLLLVLMAGSALLASGELWRDARRRRR